MSIQIRCLSLLVLACLLAGAVSLSAAENERKSRKTNQGKLAEATPSVESLTDNDIRQRLSSRTSLTIDSVPLGAIVDLLRDELRVPILIDQTALDEIGFDPATKIHASTLRDISFQSALGHLLAPLEMTYVVQDGAISVTTTEAAIVRVRTRVYPVGDLISFSNPLWPKYQDPDSLIEMITDSVTPESWETWGGPGSIDIHRGNLVIRQVVAEHYQIERLLAALRLARKLADESTDCTPKVVSVSTQDKRTQPIYEILDRTATLHDGESTLQDFCEWIQAQFGVNVVLDHHNLENSHNATADTLVLTFADFKGSLRQILNLTLRQHDDLTWLIRNEAIVITTIDESEAWPIVRVYPVADLLGPATAASDFADDERSSSSDRLSELIQTTIAVQTWNGVGGFGTLSSHPQIDVLAIAQTPQVHRQIEELLQRLREELHDGPRKHENESPFVAVSDTSDDLSSEEDTDPLGGDPFGSNPFAGDAEQTNEREPDSDLLIVYFVPTKNADGKVIMPWPKSSMPMPPVVGQRSTNTQSNLTPAPVAAQYGPAMVSTIIPVSEGAVVIAEDELLGMLIELTGSEQWRDTQNTIAKALPGRLVIRQKASMHRKIHRLLDRLAVTYYTSPEYPRPVPNHATQHIPQGCGGGMF